MYFFLIWKLNFNSYFEIILNCFPEVYLQNGHNAQSDFDMVHLASFSHTIVFEAGVENTLELVHSLYSDVDIRRYAAHIRLVSYDITLQKWTGKISQHDQQKYLVHNRCRTEDGCPNYYMHQAWIYKAWTIHLHRYDTYLVTVTCCSWTRVRKTDAK